MCLYAHREPYIPPDIMIERMIELNSSASNMYRVVDDNSNLYRNMIMNVMRMN